MTFVVLTTWLWNYACMTKLINTITQIVIIETFKKTNAGLTMVKTSFITLWKSWKTFTREHSFIKFMYPTGCKSTCANWIGIIMHRYKLSLNCKFHHTMHTVITTNSIINTFDLRKIRIMSKVGGNTVIPTIIPTMIDCQEMSIRLNSPRY